MEIIAINIVDIDNDNQLSMLHRWEESGDRVDMGPGRLLKHQSDATDLAAYDDTHAYLKPTGFDSSCGYLQCLPYFDLFLEVGSDTEDEFLCMKSGARSS